MPNENSRNGRALDNAVAGITTSLDVVKREVADCRLDTRTIQTRLDGIEKSVDKLRIVVLEGNGADPLRTQVGLVQRELLELGKDLEETRADIVARAAEDKKDTRSFYMAAAALVAAVGGPIVEWLLLR